MTAQIKSFKNPPAAGEHLKASTHPQKSFEIVDPTTDQTLTALVADISQESIQIEAPSQPQALAETTWQEGVAIDASGTVPFLPGNTLAGLDDADIFSLAGTGGIITTTTASNLISTAALPLGGWLSASSLAALSGKTAGADAASPAGTEALPAQASTAAAPLVANQPVAPIQPKDLQAVIEPNAPNAPKATQAENTLAADDAANKNDTAAAFKSSVDSLAPSLTITDNFGALGRAVLIAGDHVTLTFNLSEASHDFDATDITAIGGALSHFVAASADGKIYTADFTPDAGRSADAIVTVAAGQFHDTAGNGNTELAAATTFHVNTAAVPMSKAVAIPTPLDVLAPAFTSGTDVNFAENGTGIVYTATATDANAITYGLTGTDSGNFSLDSKTGAVSFKSRPNFESPTDADGNNNHDITLTARDSLGNTSSQNVTVHVTNVFEKGDSKVQFFGPKASHWDGVQGQLVHSITVDGKAYYYMQITQDINDPVVPTVPNGGSHVDAYGDSLTASALNQLFNNGNPIDANHRTGSIAISGSSSPLTIALPTMEEIRDLNNGHVVQSMSYSSFNKQRMWNDAYVWTATASPYAVAAEGEMYMVAELTGRNRFDAHVEGMLNRSHLLVQVL